jgi:hypothetical protein
VNVIFSYKIKRIIIYNTMYLVVDRLFIIITITIALLIFGFGLLGGFYIPGKRQEKCPRPVQCPPCNQLSQFEKRDLFTSPNLSKDNYAVVWGKVAKVEGDDINLSITFQYKLNNQMLMDTIEVSTPFDAEKTKKGYILDDKYVLVEIVYNKNEGRVLSENLMALPHLYETNYVDQDIFDD